MRGGDGTAERLSDEGRGAVKPKDSAAERWRKRAERRTARRTALEKQCREDAHLVALFLEKMAARDSLETVAPGVPPSIDRRFGFSSPTLSTPPMHAGQVGATRGMPSLATGHPSGGVKRAS